MSLCIRLSVGGPSHVPVYQVVPVGGPTHVPMCQVVPVGGPTHVPVYQVFAGKGTVVSVLCHSTGCPTKHAIRCSSLSYIREKGIKMGLICTLRNDVSCDVTRYL